MFFIRNFHSTAEPGSNSFGHENGNFYNSHDFQYVRTIQPDFGTIADRRHAIFIPQSWLRRGESDWDLVK